MDLLATRDEFFRNAELIVAMTIRRNNINDKSPNSRDLILIEERILALWIKQRAITRQMLTCTWPSQMQANLEGALDGCNEAIRDFKTLVRNHKRANLLREHCGDARSPSWAKRLSESLEARTPKTLMQ